MIKSRNKNKMSIYKKLVFSYVQFSLLLIILLGLSLFGVFWLQTSGRMNGAEPYNVASEAACKENMTGISGLNGWVEKLDESYQVSKIYGEKQTGSRNYTVDDLFELINGNQDSSCEYIGFLNPSTDSTGYYLIQYHRADIQLKPTVMYSTENSRPLWSRLVAVIFLALFIGACVLMGTYLSRRIRRPLADLSDGMSRVKAGEEGVILDFQAEAEFAEIRDAFNIMTRSLAAARQEKEEAEERKNKMLLELSHDIRTPITTINSFAVALEEDMVQEADKPQYYRTIRTKAIQVSRLADDMFTMLKMKSSDYQLQKKQDNICEFLRRLCAEYYPVVEERGLQMSAVIPEGDILYEADYPLLARVLGNLLTNAVMYNRTGRQVEVRLEPKERQMVITVADDGEAVAASIRDRLFDDFVRGDGARKSDGGTGLGLSIAKAIIVKHGGQISYQYQDEKNCFIIRL